MDYKIDRNARLFEDVLDALNRHRKEPGVVEAFDDMKAAKINYEQRSLDHMVNCLVLAIHDLAALEHPLSETLRNDLRSVIDRHYQDAMAAGARLSDLARQYEASGGKLLSHDEILAEVDERRGASR